VLDQDRFFAVLMSLEDGCVREEAVRKLSDQDRLLQCAVQDPDENVRAAAVSVLDDPLRKAFIAASDRSSLVREAAVRTLHDGNALFTVVQAHPDPAVRRIAVTNIRDDVILRDILMQDADAGVRQAAAAGIRDQEIIKELVFSAEMEGRDSERLELTLNLQDIPALNHLAEQDSDTAVRIAAVSKIHNPRLRRKIAADHSLNDLLRAEAVAGLYRDDVLPVYLEDEEWAVSLAAMTAMEDQELFLKTACDEDCWGLFREEAIRHITDEKVLLDIALHFARDSVYSDSLAAAATETIKAPDRLVQVVLEARDPSASEAAVKKLHDDEKLLKILAGIDPHRWELPADDKETRDSAAEKIKIIAADNIGDRQLLVEPVLAAPDSRFKRHCIRLLAEQPDILLEYADAETDDGALQYVLENTADPGVLRRIALKDSDLELHAEEKLSWIRRLDETGLCVPDESRIFMYPPYSGDGPYVFLNCSEWDGDIIPETVRQLNRAGFHVCYDSRVFDAFLWDTKRSEMIAGCTVFMDIHTPCRKTSHIRFACREYAEQLKKPYVYIEMDEAYRKYYENDDPEDFAGSPEEPDFMDKCVNALAAKGLKPDMDAPSGKTDEVFDPVLIYYEHYGDGDRGYAWKRRRSCDLRTRTVYSYDGKQLTDDGGPVYLTDEELYRCLGWRYAGFRLKKREDQDDYVPTEEDRSFMHRLCLLKGSPIPEIDEEYRKAAKRTEESRQDYPYMDEFEYIDSQFD
ncbi:MAG: hypothetical protein K6G61_04470, partial [Solobacterium sp.]|nr:hypothetical protein [Solobacterium sp.]